jgi:pyrroline-5-carboxylate reductase
MKIGFIGGGKMAEAIISDLVKSGIVTSRDIFVCDLSEERRRILKRRHGVNVYADNNMLIGTTDIVFLAVKPQNQDEVLKEIENFITNKHLVISIAAGRKIIHIESMLPDTKVVRVMPNLAAMISEGMSVFCMGSHATDDDRKKVITLLSCFGQVLELPEKQFDAVTAISGSGPAFFAYILSGMIEAAEKIGLEHSAASLLAEQTMLGTAMLLAKGEFNAENLIAAVSSAKGTTVAGMDVITNSDIKQIIADTLEASAKRSEELSK